MPHKLARELGLKSAALPLFVAFVGISLVVWWAPLIASFSLALNDEQYTHILLILPISAVLILVDWKSSRESGWESPEPSAGANAVTASAFLVLAVLVNAFLRWRPYPSPDIQLAMSMLALVVWWLAAFRLCFGPRAFRNELFPLAFLLWMVPLPEFLVNLIVSLLQRGSAVTAHLLFATARIPVAQRGLLIHIPGLTLEVAPECSSIRSSLFLLVITMIIAHLFLHSPLRKALLVAAAIPLSAAKNGLRIFTLGVLATRVDPSFLTGKLHRDGGIIFLLIALGGVLLFLQILRRGELRD